MECHALSLNLVPKPVPQRSLSAEIPQEAFMFGISKNRGMTKSLLMMFLDGCYRGVCVWSLSPATRQDSSFARSRYGSKGRPNASHEKMFF